MVFVAETNENITITSSVASENTSLVFEEGYGNISGNHSGVSHRTPAQFSFTVRDGGAYLYLFFGGNSLPHFYVYRNGVRVWDMNIDVLTNGQVNSYLMTGTNFPNGYWPSGTYTVQIVFGKLNEAYATSIGAYKYPNLN